MAQDIDLHALANMRGFGAARAALIKAGEWDEHIGTGRRQKYSVLVEIDEDETTIVNVRARCEAEAEQLAERAVSGTLKVGSKITDIEIMEQGK